MNLGRIDDYTTANIGRFEGGSTNIVAEKVTLNAEARSHSEESIVRQVNHMKSVLKQQQKVSLSCRSRNHQKLSRI